MTTPPRPDGAAALELPRAVDATRGHDERSPVVPEADCIIRTRNVCVRYGERTVLSGVDAWFPRGRVTAIVGPSGCGKSTFLTVLNRLTDLTPGCRVGGTVRIDGEDILDPGCDLLALRRKIGMIFQAPSPFPLSVRKNLTMPLREHGVRSRARRAERAERALREVGLWDEIKDRLDKSALALSGGQQQRLCIARALVLEPRVLLMDEPCSALDPLASGVVEDLVTQLRSRLTVVVVTHNLAQARRIADQVAVFWVRDVSGRLVEQGATEQIFGAPRDPMTQAYIAGMRG